MRIEEVATIRGMSLFYGMSGEHFDAVLQGSCVKKFPPRVQLITEGSPAEFLYFVLEGTIELFASFNGRDTTMLVVRPLSSFILAAVLNDAVYLMSARTLVNARILMIPAENVRKTMEIDPEFSRMMVIALAQSYRIVIRAFKERKLRSGMERLANYILRAYAQSPEPGQIELTENKRTLAGLLDITPEYLSRALKKLRAYGVEIQGGRITLSNPSALKHFAKPTPLIDDREI